MGRNNYFQFKQFIIHQEKAAMKVGTDGTLLGAWATVDNCSRILDVGAGTGLIALMMAQRSEATVTAIEIEEYAAIDAKQNVDGSPWRNRVNVQHISLQKYARDCTDTFDLIVSNPPFFSRAYKAGNENRTLARHNDTLPFSELFSISAELLNSKGKLALILPFDAANYCEELATENELFIIRKTEVKPNAQKNANRVLLEFSKKEAAPIFDCLTIYKENGDYTDAYKLQTKEFYLKF